MNKAVKITLGTVAGLSLLCLCGAVSLIPVFTSSSSILSGLLRANAAESGSVAASIAGYDLPAGFGEPFATQMAGFSMVAYTGDDQHSHIYLFQLPSNVHISQTDIKRQFNQAVVVGNREMVVVDEIPATIMGQPVTLVVSEGRNHDRQLYRQVDGMFEGKGGQALVVISGPVHTWDQTVVDEFIASIR
jgi:hypothetical protein